MGRAVEQMMDGQPNKNKFPTDVEDGGIDEDVSKRDQRNG